MPFEVVSQSEYILVKLKGECISDEKPTVYEGFKQLMDSSGLKLVIVQCSECSLLTIQYLRTVLQIYKEVHKVNGKLRLVGANKAVVDLIGRNGLDRILINKLSLRGALVDFDLVKAKEFDVNFINPFLNATLKVFKIQCFLEAKPLKPFLKKPDGPALLGDVSGIISVSSESFVGNFAISLSEDLFKKIAQNMLGQPCEAISDKNVDLVGELANMILGQAKLELATLGYSVQVALPSCVWGKDHKIKTFGAGLCVVIPFECAGGTFYSEVMTKTMT